MKRKHFPIILFGLLFFFISGCQKETPVSPIDEVGSLERIRPIEVNGNLVASDLCGFQDIELTWSPIRKAVFYRVSYQKATTEKEVIQEFGPDQLSAICRLAIRQVDGRSASIFVQAFKMRKDTPVLIASTAKLFNYNGTSVINHLLSGELKNIDNHADFYANWDWSGEINNIDHYYFEFLCKWEAEEHSGTTTTPAILYSPTDHTAAYPDMVKLVVWAFDNQGNCLGSGYRGFAY